MRIQINLATRPYVELRPLFARLRLVMAVLALVAVGLGVWLHALNAKAAVAEAQMKRLQDQTTAFQNERIHNEARMKQPVNSAVLERSQFLNDVFARKSFSWTAVMMDLERVLPAGVQVTNIEPMITPDGDVSIRLHVSGERDQAIQLVRNLERSQRFLHSRLASESLHAADAKTLNVAQMGPPMVEFDIVSGYNPLPAAAEKKVEAKQKAAKDDDGSKDASPVKVHDRKPQTAKPAVPKPPVQKTSPAKAGGVK